MSHSGKDHSTYSKIKLKEYWFLYPVSMCQVLMTVYTTFIEYFSSQNLPELELEMEPWREIKRFNFIPFLLLSGDILYILVCHAKLKMNILYQGVNISATANISIRLIFIDTSWLNIQSSSHARALLWLHNNNRMVGTGTSLLAVFLLFVVLSSDLW